jgi:hypothetical protein
MYENLWLGAPGSPVFGVADNAHRGSSDVGGVQTIHCRCVTLDHQLRKPVRPSLI